MIELIVRSRCTDCRTCVLVCPTNVFDIVDGQPYIARQSDCQTCFLCELYCPSDAIYVDPDAERARAHVDEAEVIRGGTLGEYRRYSGWDDASAAHPNLFWRQGELFARGAAASPPDGLDTQAKQQEGKP